MLGATGDRVSRLRYKRPSRFAGMCSGPTDSHTTYGWRVPEIRRDVGLYKSHTLRRFCLQLRQAGCHA